MTTSSLNKLSKRNRKGINFSLPPNIEHNCSNDFNSNNINNCLTPENMFDQSFENVLPKNKYPLSKAFVLKQTHLPISNFNKEISNIMDNYKYDSLEEDTNEGKTDIINLLPKIHRESYKKEKEEIRSYFKLNKSQSTPSLSNHTNVSNNLDIYNQVKFDFLKEQFKSPIHAYHLIQKNKVIYEGMVQNFEMFEKNSFREGFKRLGPLVHLNFKNILSKGYKPLSKVKISTKIPKTIDLSWFNPNNQKQNHNKESKSKRKKHNAQSPDNNSDNKQQSSSRTNKNNFSVQLLVKLIYPNNNFPESREQFVFAQNERDILLHGGLVSNKSNLLWKFIPNAFRWKRIDLKSINMEPRYGHTGVIYNRKLFIFGGRYLNLPLMGDVDVFNLDTKTWTTPPLQTYAKLKLRRNHVAISVGNQMFVHGGIDENGNYLNDCYLLNYNPIKWLSCSIHENTLSPTLAFHKCCLVLPEMSRINPRLNIYRLPEGGTKRSSINSIREKGIYFFGGKQSENSLPVEDLYVLRIGRRPLEWAKLITKGIGPSARYSTSINYYEEGNSIVIHGGRNDKNSDNFALNDTYILELYSLNWLKVSYCFEMEGMKMFYRCSHESIIYGHLLIIFGGMNSDNYIGSEFCVIELDSNKKIMEKQIDYFEEEDDGKRKDISLNKIDKK